MFRCHIWGGIQTRWFFLSFWLLESKVYPLASLRFWLLRWVTGVRMLRPCQAWKAARRCLTPAASKPCGRLTRGGTREEVTRERKKKIIFLSESFFLTYDYCNNYYHRLAKCACFSMSSLIVICLINILFRSKIFLWFIFIIHKSVTHCTLEWQKMSVSREDKMMIIKFLNPIKVLCILLCHTKNFTKNEMSIHR